MKFNAREGLSSPSMPGAKYFSIEPLSKTYSLVLQALVVLDPKKR